MLNESRMKIASRSRADREPSEVGKISRKQSGERHIRVQGVQPLSPTCASIYQ